MNDELEFEEVASERETPTADAAAVALAMGAADRRRANAFLDSQTAIAELRREHLHEQRGLEISHLRWRRFNDWARAGWQSMLGLVATLIVVVIGTAMWNASHASGLIVDAFTVPPDFEHRGVGGDVIAGDVTDRLAAIRQIAVNISYSNTADVSRNSANAIKVEIPDTGVSIGEVWRYLRAWLGHERQLTGSLREAADGSLILSASLDGTGSFVAAGKASDLPPMEQKLAEAIFGAFDPVNHINYLSAIGRRREAMDAAARFASVAHGLYHADAFALWSYTTAFATGDFQAALARAHVGESIDPKLAVPHVMAARMNFFMGRSEDELAEDRTIMSLANADQLPAHQDGGFTEMQAQAGSVIALLAGDFAHAKRWNCSHTCTYAGLLLSDSIIAARLHDGREARRLLDRGFAAGGANLADAREARYWRDAGEGRWSAALADTRGLTVSYAIRQGDFDPRFLAVTHATYVVPLVAVANAHIGRFVDAHTAINRTPVDCVPCETARGDVAALEKNWSGAAYWFAHAVRDAPSVPFAQADWGEMLLHEGDYDGAIEKFREANRKGPHFADPLEMWGEALIAKNRSDLALAKFEEADKYAPNWGRLHLKWGEALLYVGRTDEARSQFAKAARLDLSESDQRALAIALKRR